MFVEARLNPLSQKVLYYLESILKLHLLLRENLKSIGGKEKYEL